LAFQTTTEEGRAIWIYDLASGTPVRRTLSGYDASPEWTPDGQRIAFASDREGGLFWQVADGSNAPEGLTRAEPGTLLQPEAWLPNGKTLILSVGRAAQRGLLTLEVGTGRQPVPLIPGWASNSSLSPRGEWLAYMSMKSASELGTDVYVERFPPRSGAKHLVSTDGGGDPLWSPDGKQLFYVQPKGGQGQIVSVDVQTQPTFSFGKATPLPIDDLVRGGARQYDISPDGRYFVVTLPAASSGADGVRAEQITVALNWFEELKARVPGK
jgi:Tol biopolymer transport system component